MKSKFFPALAVLIGTTVGAGFLGIPYVVSKAGFFPGLIYLIFVALFMLLIKFYLGEVILRTKGNHQLAGYAERYLGKKGKLLMFFSMLFGLYSALVAYLIGEGQSLSYIIFGHTNFAFYFTILFWLLVTFLSYIGLKALKTYEKIGVVFAFVFVSIIFIFFFKNIKFGNLIYADSGNIFMPLGVILFSFLAFSAMPEVERVLFGQEKLMKKVIFLGVLIPLIFYLLFTIAVVGSFGKNVPEISTMVLGRVFSLLGVITMFTAALASIIAARDMFRFDFHLGRFNGWLIGSFVPLFLFLVIYFFKLASFVQILTLGGIVSGGLTGILVLLMNTKAKKLGNRKPEFSVGINWLIVLLLSIIFVLAVVLELRG